MASKCGARNEKATGGLPFFHPDDVKRRRHCMCTSISIIFDIEGNSLDFEGNSEADSPASVVFSYRSL